MARDIKPPKEIIKQTSRLKYHNIKDAKSG